MRIIGYIVSCVLSSIVGGVVVLVWLTSGEASLVLRKLEIADNEGQLRARLHVTDSGRVSFALGEPNSGPKLLLGVNREGVPSIGLFRKDSNPALVVTTKNEEPGLFFYSLGEKHARLGISVVESNSGIAIFDKNDKAVWSVWESDFVKSK